MGTVGALVLRTRSEFLDDIEGSDIGESRWLDADIVAALNWAERELCKRLHLISDSASELCEVDTYAGMRDYPLSRLILRIDRLKLSGVTRPLIQKTMEYFDLHDEGWEEREGVPTMFLVDRTHSLTFNRTPEDSGSFSMIVSRLPLIPMDVDTMATASPELREMDEEIIHGALSRLYLKDDRTTFDQKRSGYWEMIFDQDMSDISRVQDGLSPRSYVMRPDVW